jgi:glycosyltransferase involved in cell wall biosynthesis
MLGKGFGGAERSFVDTALALAARGHAVQAICHAQFSKIGLLQNVPNLEVQTVNAKGEWDFLAPRKIEKLLRAFKAEIVHTQLKRAAWHGGRGAKRAGVPVVSKLHNYVDLARYKYVHTLFCTTQDQRRHVLDADWPVDRVEVVPNFSRLEPLASPRGHFESPLRCLTYGRYVKKKGFDILLRAFRQLLDTGVNANLTIGGGGEELEALQALVIELELGDYVDVGVWIDDVSNALDAADIFVLPSLDEPFGIVMLEAMARGVPIISTKTKGPTEVLSAETARLVEIGSVDALYHALREVVLDHDGALLRAKRALSLYEEIYYEGALIPRIEALYTRVIAQSR